MGKGLIVGFLLAFVVLIGGAFFLVSNGALYAGQDVNPGAIEKWVAKRTLRSALQPARALQNPLPATDDNLAAGVALYVSRCQICHGGPDATPSAIAKGLTPHAPQLAKDGVEDDPEGTIYWKIAHGIRFTGMPSFRQSLSEREMWQIALFAKHMNALPPGARQAWAASRTAP